MTFKHSENFNIIPGELRNPLAYDEEVVFRQNEFELARQIPQNKLNNAKLFNSRYEYSKTLNKNISYLEIGVAWGYSAKMFIDATDAKSADLLDVYNNCEGVLEPGGSVPELGSQTHEEYIKNKFSYHPNVNTIKGYVEDLYTTINKKYDFIFIDMDTDRFLIRKLLLHFSKLVNDGGIIGLTSYTNYNIRYNRQTGVFQSVNEFLVFNDDWSVDAIILDDVAVPDIYIKKIDNKRAV